MLGYKTSTDGGSTWSSSWTVITTLSSSATSGSRTFTPSSLSGIYTIGNWYKFAVWTIDALDVYSNQTESIAIQCAQTTACEAPTTVTLAPYIVEINLSLSWSGASPGIGNTITGYALQLSESSDGANWGEWQIFTMVSSTATSGIYTGINPPATRGAYRRFRVQTQGVAGSTYYSAWAVSNAVRRNTLPTPPTMFTASPASYFDTPVSLTWNGTVAGTSSIKSYIIQLATSMDGTNWSGWSSLATVTTSATSGSYSTTPSNIDGMRTKYRLAVMDVLDAVSGYVESNVVMKQLAPETPIVTAPTSGSTTHNTQPRFLIKTGGTPDGRTQRFAVRIDNGVWVDSVANPTMFSVNGALPNGTSTIFQPAALSVGTHTAVVKAVNDSGSSAEITRTFTIAQPSFGEIVQYVTIVTAAQVNTLHNAANSIRAYYGQINMRWVDPIIVGKTQVRDWPLHVAELRSGVEGVIYAVNGFDAEDTFDIAIPQWIAMTGGYPRADVMNQLSSIIAQL